MLPKVRLSLFGSSQPQQVELDIPPELFLTRLRNIAPEPFLEGGPFFASTPVRSRIQRASFELFSAGKGGQYSRLTGQLEPTAVGCSIRFRVEVSPVHQIMLLTISLVLLSTPLLLVLFSPAEALILLLYAPIVPILALLWGVILLFQRMSSWAAVDAFQQLVTPHVILDAEPSEPLRS